MIDISLVSDIDAEGGTNFGFGHNEWIDCFPILEFFKKKSRTAIDLNCRYKHDIENSEHNIGIFQETFNKNNNLRFPKQKNGMHGGCIRNMNRCRIAESLHRHWPTIAWLWRCTAVLPQSATGIETKQNHEWMSRESVTFCAGDDTNTMRHNWWPSFSFPCVNVAVQKTRTYHTFRKRTGRRRFNLERSLRNPFGARHENTYPLGKTRRNEVRALLVTIMPMETTS